MNDNEAAADRLDGAADWIETYGWIQRHFRIGNQVCALGAISASQDEQVRLSDLVRGATSINGIAVRALRDQIGIPGATIYSRTITQWNDQPDRTEFEVINALRAAAKELRNRAG
jgi:hypothetical protein